MAERMAGRGRYYSRPTGSAAERAWLVPPPMVRAVGSLTHATCVTPPRWTRPVLGPCPGRRHRTGLPGRGISLAPLTSMFFAKGPSNGNSPDPWNSQATAVRPSELPSRRAPDPGSRGVNGRLQPGGPRPSDGEKEQVWTRVPFGVWDSNKHEKREPAAVRLTAEPAATPGLRKSGRRRARLTGRRSLCDTGRGGPW
jgi:hypothetical protein